MPVSLALSIAAKCGVVVKDRVLVFGNIWDRSILRRGSDRSMGWMKCSDVLFTVMDTTNDVYISLDVAYPSAEA
jgi:hypothetical protein